MALLHTSSQPKREPRAAGVAQTRCVCEAPSALHGSAHIRERGALHAKNECLTMPANAVISDVLGVCRVALCTPPPLAPIAGNMPCRRRFCTLPEVLPNWQRCNIQRPILFGTEYKVTPPKMSDCNTVRRGRPVTSRGTALRIGPSPALCRHNDT